MQNTLLIFQITTAILLSGLVLIQPKGTGLARGWGASSSSFTRRGLEKLVFKSTYVVAGLFLFFSLLTILV